MDVHDFPMFFGKLGKLNHQPRKLCASLSIMCWLLVRYGMQGLRAVFLSTPCPHSGESKCRWRHHYLLCNNALQCNTLRTTYKQHKQESHGSPLLFFQCSGAVIFRKRSNRVGSGGSKFRTTGTNPRPKNPQNIERGKGCAWLS